VNYDETSIPENYNRARDHGPAFLAQWMNVVASHVDGPDTSRILDLACGTGRFTEGLAERFGAVVIGIDPSRKMLQEALINRSAPKVYYAIGTAEAIPLKDESVDLVFISMAFHHFTDPATVARECHRVLRNNGILCLRTGCSEKIGEYPYIPFFAKARDLLAKHLPSLTFQTQTFEKGGFTTLSTEVVIQEIAADYSDYADKVALKADSILIRLDNKEFAAGMESLRLTAATMPARPITEPIDFVVFKKSDELSPQA
jgi:ubiquinone/menaquinone biosynthesis C-methylase UbiE